MNDCCIIVTARYEELYLDEWINYHLNLGFSHIYICDNNDKKNPLLLDHDKVSVIPCNDIDCSTCIYKGQIECYERAMLLMWDKHLYCAIIDVDEFFYFKECSSVDSFIDKYLPNRDVVEIPWEVYDDNDLIFHIDKPVQLLYTRVQNKMEFNFLLNECSWCKSIFRLHKGIKCSPHVPLGITSHRLSKNIAVVKHYRTKCLEDYIKQKCIGRNAINAPFTSGNIIKTYFLFNKVSLEKLIWSLKFCKQNNIQITQSDRMWLLNQFEIHSPITIVIRTRNRISLLKNLIESIKDLKYSCKILILNDGSTDETSEWLSTQKHVDYLTLRNNVGPGEILMRGRHMITTPYYIILDDDDLWTSNNVIEYFYNMLIDNPDSDLIQTKCLIARHVYGLVSTDLLLKCPMLSMYRHDDYYYFWIENNAKHVIEVDYKFYNYRRDLEEVTHVDSMRSNIDLIAANFYKNNYDLLKSTILNNYHSYTLLERKVCDQMLNYINKQSI